MSKLIILCMAALTMAGCSTVFNDSAPAGPNSRYIAGSRGGKAVIYLCPTKPSAASNDPCDIVDVHIKE